MPLRFATPAADAHQYPLTIRHLLDSAMSAAGRSRIVYRDQASFTYPQFRDRVGRLASVLDGLGARQGATIAVMDWDSHRYLEAYFAVPMLGAVLQTVNVRLPVEQLAYTLAHAEAEILICHRDFYPLLADMLPSLPAVRAVVGIGDGVDEPVPPFAAGEYEVLLASAPADYAFEDFDENAVATTFYTTGTTGLPKGVCFTHRQLVLHTLAVNAPFGVSAMNPGLGIDDVYMPLTPMFHVHAWGVPYVATMLGATQIYPGRYEPELICRLIATHRVTYSHCVPTILQMVFDAADRTGTDLSGWKVTIGGSALSRRLWDEGRRRGLHLHSGYGMSETCPTAAMARRRLGDGDDEDAIGDAQTASGVPAPLVKARVVDDRMEDVPHDGATRGELVLRAPWLTPCYTGDADASDALWRGGWLHTQDVATIDEDGFIRIRDRLKDVIKTGGEWIDSIRLEELVATADGVAEAAVIAVTDARWGERPFAVVVALPDREISLDGLNRPVEAAIASGAITRYARLEGYAVAGGLPRTSVGKIDKKALRARYGSFENAGAAAER